MPRKRTLLAEEEAKVPRPKKTKIKEKVSRVAKKSLLVSIPKNLITLPKRRGHNKPSLTVESKSQSVTPLVYANVPSFPPEHLSFKNKKFQLSSATVGKKKMWKNTRQITAMIKSQNYPPNQPTYANIDAPPSILPSKKYSDVSGLTAKYTDPLTGMRFNSAQEFAFLRSITPNIQDSYLSLRKAGQMVT